MQRAVASLYLCTTPPGAQVPADSMFGMSRADRDRWDRAAETVRDTRQKLEDHTTECTRRYEALERQIGGLVKTVQEKGRTDDAWNKRLMLGLVGVLLSMVASLLHAKGFW